MPGLLCIYIYIYIYTCNWGPGTLVPGFSPHGSHPGIRGLGMSLSLASGDSGPVLRLPGPLHVPLGCFYMPQSSFLVLICAHFCRFGNMWNLKPLSGENTIFLVQRGSDSVWFFILVLECSFRCSVRCNCWLFGAFLGTSGRSPEAPLGFSWDACSTLQWLLVSPQGFRAPLEDPCHYFDIFLVLCRSFWRIILCVFVVPIDSFCSGLQSVRTISLILDLHHQF